MPKTTVAGPSSAWEGQPAQEEVAEAPVAEEAKAAPDVTPDVAGVDQEPKDTAPDSGEAPPDTGADPKTVQDDAAAAAPAAGKAPAAKKTTAAKKTAASKEVKS